MPTKTAHPVLALLRPRGGIKAVVDWLDVEFVTPRRWQPGWLNKKLGSSRVTALNLGADRTATYFQARFQDPESFAQVALALRERAGVTMESGVFVRGIEVAVDFYARDNDRAKLAQITAHLAQMLKKPVDVDNRRFVKGKNERTPQGKVLKKATVDGAQGFTLDCMIQRFMDGWELVIGNHGNEHHQASDAAQRLYVKDVDNNEQPLPQDQHRARCEIRLQGNQLPFATLEQAAASNFEELADWFKWRMLKDDLSPLQRGLAGADGRLGARRIGNARNRKGGGQREFDTRTSADELLNSKVYDALRALTRRVSAGFPAVRTSDFPEISGPVSIERTAFDLDTSLSPSTQQEEDHQGDHRDNNNVVEQLAVLAVHHALDRDRQDAYNQTKLSEAGELHQQHGAVSTAGEPEVLAGSVPADSLPSFNRGLKRPDLIGRTKMPQSRQEAPRSAPKPRDVG